MAIPGLFIEYLVDGAAALVWVYPLLNPLGLFKIEVLPLTALALYVLGMAIDFAAWILTRPLKRLIRKRISDRHGLPPDHGHGRAMTREIMLTLRSPGLAKAVAMRSSRDRIARGTFVNAVLATVFVFPLFTGIILCVISLVMWVGFESVSYKFSIRAEELLDQKEEPGRGEGEYE